MSISSLKRRKEGDGHEGSLIRNSRQSPRQSDPEMRAETTRQQNHGCGGSANPLTQPCRLAKLPALRGLHSRLGGIADSAHHVMHLLHPIKASQFLQSSISDGQSSERKTAPAFQVVAPPGKMAPNEDHSYHPKDAVGEAARGALVVGGAGLFASALKTALAKQNIGAWAVFTRTGGMITTGGAFPGFTHIPPSSH